MAEREGFDPPTRLPVRRISSAVLSTTQPPLRGRIGRAKHPVGRPLCIQRNPATQGSRAQPKVARAPARFRTIQVCPKDVPVKKGYIDTMSPCALPREGATAGTGGGDARRATARAHHAARLHGGGSRRAAPILRPTRFAAD